MFDSANNLQEHARKTHMESCDYCNYESQSKEALNKHVRSAHPGLSVVICGICALSFVSIEECTAHINGHQSWSSQPETEVRTFPCDQFPQCNDTFLNIRGRSVVASPVVA